VIWAWIGAAVVGVSLGLLGSGGAILTVPILVYLVGHNEKTAIAESLAIVGVIALAGAIRAATQRRIDVRSALLLAFPGVVGTFVGAVLAHYIPGAVQLLLLAVLMLTAAVLMFRSGARPPSDLDASIAPHQRPPDSARTVGIIVAQGFGLGLATGLVGVGGGFLIVPVLVLLRRLSMPIAVGTSLAIIAVNSAVGFVKYITLLRDHGVDVDWAVMGVFAALGVAGSLVGNALSGKIPKQTLKKVFAVFLVVMAVYIVYRQAPRVMEAQQAPPPVEAGP
jgi:uncharacterized membrane protein YfcA